MVKKLKMSQLQIPWFLKQQWELFERSQKALGFSSDVGKEHYESIAQEHQAN